MFTNHFRRGFLLFISLAGVTAFQLSLTSTAHASKASMEAIRSVWPEHHASVAIRIAQRESRLQPRVRGCSGTCFGLFQISYPAHRHWLGAMGVKSASELMDPVINSKAALRLFLMTGSNWSPWCHSSGFPRYC